MEKNWGGFHRWNIKEGLSQTLKMCLIRRGLIWNVPKRIKSLIFLTKVNNINNLNHKLLIFYITPNVKLSDNILMTWKKK